MDTNEHYASRLADMREERDSTDEGSYGPDALSIETETVYRIILGTGGPHDEVAVRVRYGDVVGGTYRYIWHGMDGHGERELSPEEAEEWADAYALLDS